MRPLMLKSGRHVVVDTPLARHLRRVTGDPHIVTYFHLRNGSWVLASWFNKRCGFVIEHDALPVGCPVERCPRRVVDRFLWNRSDRSRFSVHDLAKRQASAAKDEDMRAQMDVEKHRDLREYLRKRCRLSKSEVVHW